VHVIITVFVIYLQMVESLICFSWSVCYNPFSDIGHSELCTFDDLNRSHLLECNSLNLPSTDYLV
jgi:hypothetical protein